MKSALTVFFYVLFMFAFQTQSLAAYAFLNCGQQHSSHQKSIDFNSHSHEDHKSDETSVNEHSENTKKESCSHQHRCCHSTSAALQAVKSQTNISSPDNLNLKFSSQDELAIEAPTLEGPFQPPRA